MTDPSATRPAPDLTSAELRRYGRHLALTEVGPEGQRRLSRARVLLVGAGGLGSPVALYLAAAGVGHLTVVDPDVVEETNLQRQVLHGTRDVGRPKVASALDRLRDLNPLVEVEGLPARLDRDNALALVGAHDLVVDGTDNFATRYLVNDACVLTGRRNVYASVFRFEGQASVLAAPDGPCYRCLYPSPPPPGVVPSCAEGGVLGVLPGLLGVIQATEALKLLLGIGEPLVGRLLLVDALGMELRTMKVRRDPRCPACGTRQLDRLQDYEALCAGPPPEARDPASRPGPARLAPAELAGRLARGDDLQLLDVREPWEWALGHVAGARHVPLGALSGALAGLDRGREVVVYCRAGPRSARAAQALLEAGFPRVAVLDGGILRYSDDVDASLPKY